MRVQVAQHRRIRRKFVDRLIICIRVITDIAGRFREPVAVNFRAPFYFLNERDDDSEHDIMKIAAKCDRALILQGCELLGMELRDVAAICIEGMKAHAQELGLLGTES